MKQKIAQIYKRLIFNDFLFLEYNFCTVVLNLRQLSVSEIFFLSLYATHVWRWVLSAIIAYL